ncbi:MAG: isocitrate lyase/phosphoenolpyruvate mutase family protein [Pseudomonadota bacterium]
MSQAEKAAQFAALHQTGNPLVLYNIWDAGGAKALAEARAPAVATGSWSMATAHGFDDGEAMPLDLVLIIVERICAAVDVPLTVDFEGGYAVEPGDVAENVRKVMRAGAIGINFEDRIVRGDGLYPFDVQSARIAAIRVMAKEEGIPLFINARTDLFLGADPATHQSLLPDALDRAAAYAAAGADCIFVPGLTEQRLIADVVAGATLPVNVMMMGELASLSAVADLGVARASYGPGADLNAIADLQDRYRAL